MKENHPPERTDILIVGAGIMGLTLAMELIKKGCDDIVIIEKETDLGRHASGRNSGVLHAGIYYAPESAKAETCLTGNRKMLAFCKENGIKTDESGKVIVTRNESELPVLHELFKRARANGADVKLVDEKELSEMEPNAKTVKTALLSRFTATVDPNEVLKKIKENISSYAKIINGCMFRGIKGSHTAVTNLGDIRFSRFINAAGAHCDKVAHAFGIAKNYCIAPFKGIYFKLNHDAPYTVNGSIYPVPDIRNPFLGVHFTRSVHGDVYLGPTAIPAFGRENYGILKGVDSEAFQILARDAVMFFRNPKFRQVALTEPGKYLKTFFYNNAKKLVKRLEPHHIQPAPKVGIRPQLIHWPTKELEMDFMVEKDGDAVHVLNPVSPAFTCSMALSERIVDEYFT